MLLKVRYCCIFVGAFYGGEYFIVAFFPGAFLAGAKVEGLIFFAGTFESSGVRFCWCVLTGAFFVGTF